MRISKLATLFFVFCISATLYAAEGKQIAKNNYERGDSIMYQVMRYAKLFSGYVQKFDGEMYLKGNTYIQKSNFLYKWFPWVFPFDPSNEKNVFEILNEIHFVAPNHFKISPLALRSTSKRPIKNMIDVSPLLNLNVYNSTSFNDKFIMPGSPYSRGIYEYRLDSIITDSLTSYYKVRFIPRRKNLKVISGHLYIKKNTPYITRIDAEGYLDIARFKLTTKFGQEYEHFMLPFETNIQITYDILNNISINDYYCKYVYHELEIEEDPRKFLKWKKNKSLDLTRYYSLDKKTVPVIEDSLFWIARCQYLLTSSENSLTNSDKELYENKIISDSIRKISLECDSVRRIDYLKMSEMLLSHSDFGKEDLQWRYSGLINPSMVGYSKTNGIVLRQRISLNKKLPDDRFISLRPEIGFSFKQKELFYRFSTDWLYKPNKLGMLSFSFQSGNKGFSSSFIDQVNHALDTTGIQFDHLNIDYYRDYHFQLENAYELRNGLLCFAGINYNIHKPVKGKVELPENNDTEPIIKNNYADFVPFIRLSWTPRQYYRMIGQRKQYLPAPLPTLSLEYSKGIPKIFGSDSQFDKIEFDIHQCISLSKLRTFSYRAGLGAFFNQKSEYFVDFRHFRRSNYPASWNDHIGGVFNLLDPRWYYASPKYIQLHLMYDSPFLLLHAFKRISKFVLSERLYFSQLYTPAKPYYSEIGYGMGNYIFNVAIFTNFHSKQFKEVGFRFSFELGRYW